MCDSGDGLSELCSPAQAGCKRQAGSFAPAFCLPLLKDVITAICDCHGDSSISRGQWFGIPSVFVSGHSEAVRPAINVLNPITAGADRDHSDGCAAVILERDLQGTERS